MDTQHTTPCAELHALSEAINGNGKAGLKERMATSEIEIRGTKADIVQIKETVSAIQDAQTRDHETLGLVQQDVTYIERKIEKMAAAQTVDEKQQSFWHGIGKGVKMVGGAIVSFFVIVGVVATIFMAVKAWAR